MLPPLAVAPPEPKAPPLELTPPDPGAPPLAAVEPPVPVPPLPLEPVVGAPEPHEATSRPARDAITSFRGYARRMDMDPFVRHFDEFPSRKWGLGVT